MNPDEFVAKARAAGKSDADIAAFLKTKGIDWSPTQAKPAAGMDTRNPLKGYDPLGSLDNQRAQDVQRATVNGLMLGHLPDLKGALAGAGALLHGQPAGQAFDSARTKGFQDLAAGTAREPLQTGAAGVAGNLLPALMSGGAAAPSALGNLARGAVVGGLSASGTEHPTLTGTAGGAMFGGALATLLTPVVQAVGGKLADVGGKAVEAVRRSMQPAREIARTAGIVLPKDAEAILARQEQLSPGTGVVGQLSEPLRALSRNIAADPRSGAIAAEQSAARVATLKQDLGTLGQGYDNFTVSPTGAPVRAPVTPEARAVARAHGIPVTPINPQHPELGDWVSAKDMQDLRTELQTRLTSMQNTLKRGTAPVNGADMHQMGEDVQTIRDWLHSTFGPPFAKLDDDYAFLSARQREARLLDKHIQQSIKSTTSSRGAGIEPGSPAGAIPKTRSSLLEKLMQPNRASMAKENLRQTLTNGAPLDALRSAQQSIMAPPAPPAMRGVPGLLGLAGGQMPDDQRLQGLLAQ